MMSRLYELIVTMLVVLSTAPCLDLPGPHKKPQSVLLAGDSVIAMMGMSSVLQISPMWMSEWENRAAGGYTTQKISKLVDDIGTSYTDVFLEGGINDYLFGEERLIIPGYQAMIEAIPTDVKIHLIGIIPIDDASVTDTYKTNLSNDKVAATNRKLEALCALYRNCITVAELMHLSAAGLTYDGLHFVAGAYLILGNAIRRSLDYPTP